MSNTQTVKLACYSANISMAVVANLPPLLFLTFRSLYGLSYSELGLLVVINYVTQLAVDLIFSFFSYTINMKKAVKFTPVITLSGLFVYMLAPILFPGNVYTGLLIGTLIFSASGGFVEVLISPVIAALPSDNPDRDMSRLHSTYAWGTVFVIILSSVYIYFIGGESWQWLIGASLVIPLVSTVFFIKSEIPEMETPGKLSGVFKILKKGTLWLYVGAIFLGGATECTMAQWASGYLEKALGIPKIWGDIFGVATFALFLGLGRTLYSAIGKNIGRILVISGTGAFFCYIVCALSPYPIIGLIACALTGFASAMLWPGSLIAVSEGFPVGGVFIFAMMAAGGDFGASVGPQLIGSLTDFALTSRGLIDFAASMGIRPEQLGLKLGMLAGSVFPLLSIPVYIKISKALKKK